MGKSGNGKDVRYHRVDLMSKSVAAKNGAKHFSIGDDDDDSDSELERDLGPSSRRRAEPGSTSRASNKKCCIILRSGCIAFTVIFTLAGLAAVVIYSSVLFPLKDKYMYVTDVDNSTTLNNKNSVSNDTTSEEENPLLNATTTTTVEPSSNHLSGEENPENKNPDITDPTDKPENPSDNESVIEKKNKRMSNNNQQMMKSDEERKHDQSFDDSDFFDPESEAFNSNPLEKKGKTDKDIQNLGALIEKWDPIFWNEEQDPNVSYDKDDESEDDNKSLFPTKDPSSVRKDRDMFGTEEPDMMDLAEDKEMKSITTTTKNNENVVDEKVPETTVKAVTSSSTSTTATTTTATKTTTTTTTEFENATLETTTESVEENGNNNTTTYQQQITQMAHNIWVRYKENDVYVIVSILGLAAFFLLLFIACLMCRYRARAEAKKRHFKRLINDLNATEKFSIVTPSEDEDFSD